MRVVSSTNKVSLRLYGMIFSIGLLLLPGAIFGAFWLANPDTVKEKLRESRAYDAASDVIVGQIARDSLANIKGATTLPKGSLERALRRVATPDRVQQKVETYITHNYAWLDGKKSKPMETLDFTEEKKLLAKELGREASDHIKGKPVCGVSQLLENRKQLEADPVSAPCQVPGVSRKVIEDAATAKIQERLQVQQAPNVDTRKKSVSSGVAVAGPGVEIGPFIKGVYWWLKHGFMTVLSVLMFVAAISFAILRSGRRWFSWAAGLFVGVAVFLFMSIIPISLVVYTDIVSVSVIPAAFRSVVDTLALPFIITVAVVAGVYLIVGLFGIMWGARRGSERDTETGSYGASGSYPGAPGGPAGKSF